MADETNQMEMPRPLPMEPRQQADRVQVKVEEGSVAQSGLDIVCSECSHSHEEPAPADTTGCRLWETIASEGAPLCHWCGTLRRLLPGELKPPSESAHVGEVLLEWNRYLQALWSLTMEGGSPITKTMLHHRRQMIQKLFGDVAPQVKSPANLPPQNASPSKRSTASGTTLAGGTSDGGSPSATTSARGSSSVMAFSSPGPVSPGKSVHGESQFASKAPGGPRSESSPAGAASSGQRAMHILSSSAPPTGKDSHDAASPTTVTDMSVAGEFPAGSELSSSLLRMRATINLYIDEMCSPGWFENYRTETVKALARRFLKKDSEVQKSMHLELIEGCAGAIMISDRPSVQHNVSPVTENHPRCRPTCRPGLFSPLCFGLYARLLSVMRFVSGTFASHPVILRHESAVSNIQRHGRFVW